MILVIDASGSMQARDVKPTRLEAAQDAVRTFLKKVPKSVRVGLVVFAGEPQVASPPTTDRGLVLQVGRRDRRVLRLRRHGDRRRARRRRSQLGLQAIDDPAGNRNSRADGAAPRQDPARPRLDPLPLGRRADARPAAAAAGRRHAKAVGFPVYTVALGTPHGTLHARLRAVRAARSRCRPTRQTLHAIAERTGGKFFTADSADAVQAAYSKLGSSLGRTPGKTEVTFAFLLGGIVLLLAAGVASALFAPRFP